MSQFLFRSLFSCIYCIRFFFFFHFNDFSDLNIKLYNEKVMMTSEPDGRCSWNDKIRVEKKIIVNFNRNFRATTPPAAFFCSLTTTAFYTFHWWIFSSPWLCLAHFYLFRCNCKLLLLFPFFFSIIIMTRITIIIIVWLYLMCGQCISTQ